jgi:glutathione S-transferase
MYKLHNIRRWGSMAPHLVLEELGVPYENVWMMPAELATPGFRALSPLGLIPVLGLRDGRSIIESMAIVVHLTDANRDKKLAPPPGTDDHAIYLSWLAFMSSNLYPAISIAFAPDSYATNESERAAVRKSAEASCNRMFDVLENRLASKGPFVLGETFSAADLYLFMLTVWGRPTERGLLQRCPAIAEVAEYVRGRPKLKAALDAHGVLEIGTYEREPY